ncbi:MAG: hypothetical protein HFF99_07380 [Oscillibacter sp.]|nr:hypothetical protein [uncultured Oscillibacter sp.]MCI8971272.1 hypothetical protein [Oscillibacter sp.]
MELTVNGRQRRAGQVMRPASQREKKPAEAKVKTAAVRPGSDRTSWSRTALAFLQEVNRQDMEKRQKLLEARQQGDGEWKALSESLKVMDRCQKIASRIMKGDKVPPQDEQYLMENDPDGYKLALVCRTPKEKPKEWESVLEDEEREGAESGKEASEGAESAEGPAESGSAE